ncbi:low-density lipoprotein receptor-related protein 5-like isoform X1 [Trichogramma pretiosum]|uniref:low-density lipoprotein receptor-related protein 5-like isoform X1 n=2 Tax=Trichogramma pretiosum TaxID=7493 RepID=UPI000C71C189|nr:low-density lipoprotein receptor-related protein 5-like isoform X1 [Trichogramma pretiosum]
MFGMIRLIVLFAILARYSSTCSASPHAKGRTLPAQLYLLDGDELLLMNLTTGIDSPSILHKFVSAEDYDLDTDRLLWIDAMARIHSRRLNTSSRPYEDRLVLQYQPSVSTARITYDLVGRKFYVIDGESQEIDVVDESNDYQTILFERGPIKEEHVVREKPRRIVLDCKEGLMFIVTVLNGVENIYRSNMDGTSKKFLISGAGGDELVVDNPSKQIFWINVQAKVIESADYGGGNRAFVAKVQAPSVLAVYDRQLFWLAHDYAPTASSGSYIKTCQLDEVGCGHNTTRPLLRLGKLVRQPRSLKAYGIKSFRAQQSQSPCRQSNGGCRHMCLLTGAEERASCACNIGWRPSESDSRDCRMADRRNPGDRDEPRL